MHRTRDTRRRAMAGALLCALVLVGCGPAADAPPGGSGAGAAATATTSDATPVAGADALDDAMLFAAASNGHTLHAVGADDGAAAAWTSDDRGWEPSPVRGHADATRIEAVAMRGRAGVAFGADDTSPSHLWTTADGLSWQASGATASGIDGRVNAVVADGDRWLAVGDRVDPEGGESYEGVVWVSTDGRSWEVLADGLELSEGTLSDVAVDAGIVVVVGFDVGGGRVWASTDGGAFDPVGRAPFEAATVQGVAVADGGFVALGRGLGDLEPVTWESADGRDWRRVDVTASDIRPDDEVNDLSAAGDTVVAVGGSPTAAAVWTLEDGRMWRRRT